MTDHLTITRFSARDLFRFEDFKVELGKITKFTGANDQGKTSALRLAELAIQGSTNPGVIRKGATKGEVLVEFSNGYTLRRSFTDKGQYPRLTDSEGHIIPSPQAFIKSLLVENQFDPIAWLDLPPKEKISTLLEAIHVELTPEDVIDATGYEPPISIDFKRHGLTVLADLREHFASERKTENAIADRKKKAAAEMRSKLPETVPAVTDEERAKVADHLERAKATLASLETRRLAAQSNERAVADIQRRNTNLGREHDSVETEIRDLEQMIAKKRTRQEALRLEQNRLVAELDNLAQSAPPTIDETTAAKSALSAATTEQLGLSEIDKMTVELESVKAIEREAETASAQAAILDSAVKAITIDLPQLLMQRASLPVGSLTIDGDRILVEGVDVEFEATSKQMAISLAIARALNPKLRVICLDRFESLDHERREAFISAAKGDGFTYLVSEVDPAGGPLRVEVVEEVA